MPELYRRPFGYVDSPKKRRLKSMLEQKTSRNE